MLELAVIADDKELAHGKPLAELRRAGAAAARAELDRRARAAYGLAGPWRRFQIDALPESVPLAFGQCTVQVYPKLASGGPALELRYEWSAAEARRKWRQVANRPSWIVLAA